ncbi:MafI family immunity protein [Arachnia propionica]|nr:MafI family immunity protein [Arachnia propionica]
MIFTQWRERRGQAKRRRHLYEEVRKICHRYKGHWPPYVAPLIEETFLHGEEGIALETIISWLHETNIDPTKEEKQAITELARLINLPEDAIYFTPESSTNKPRTQNPGHPEPELTQVRQTLLTHFHELLKARMKSLDAFQRKRT